VRIRESPTAQLEAHQALRALVHREKPRFVQPGGLPLDPVPPAVAPVDDGGRWRDVSIVQHGVNPRELR
jgi:hypothetical protein